jgi:D-threo-aldose 1-dehydrogenase
METTREIGRTGVRVPPIAFGTAALGDIPENYGYGVDEARAIATIRAVLERPGAFLDTSRNYGLGRSEARIGEAAREMGGWPAEAVISTKLDRDMDTGRFDADQARRSLEESLEALGVERVHVLHLHDPEYAADLSEVTREGGALDALMRMKEEGLTGRSASPPGAPTS